MPGGIQSQGILSRMIKDFACSSMFPQLAVGGGTPNPRKLKAAASRIDEAVGAGWEDSG